MKHLIRLLFIYMIFGLVSNAWAGETIRLASGEWPPYQSKSLAHHGVASQIIKESFALEGIRVTFGYFPWKRSYYLAQHDIWDGTFLWFDLPERREFFYVSDAVVTIKYVFFHLKSYPFEWDHIDDLKGLRIGGVLAYDYGRAFQKAEKSGRIQVVRKSSDSDNLLRLSNKLIHIFPCDMYAGYALIHKHFKPEKASLFTHHSKPVKEAPHHLLLSKKNKGNPQMLTRFNAGLKHLKDSGRYDELLTGSQGGATPIIFD